MNTLKLLCQCISPIQNTEITHSEIYSPELDWESIVFCSGQHLSTPALWFHLNKRGILPTLSSEIQDYLKLVYDLNLSRNYKIINQLCSLLPDFNAAGIEPLLLKGIASLINDLYESPGIRVLGDIDILIPEEKLSIASDIMRQQGYSVALPIQQHQEVMPEHHHLPGFSHKDQPVRVEIHRHPVALKYSAWVNRESAREECSTIQLNAGIVKLPSPEFRLLHNFCHCQLTDKGYLKGYVNARQLLEWVKLREHYDTEFDWVSIQQKVKSNHSIAAWGGYVLAAEHFFSQAIMPNTPILTPSRLFLCRQQWRQRHSLYQKTNDKLFFLFSQLTVAISTLIFNFQRGPKYFFNMIVFMCRLLFSLEWHKKKWRQLKGVND